MRIVKLFIFLMLGSAGCNNSAEGVSPRVSDILSNPRRCEGKEVHNRRHGDRGILHLPCRVFGSSADAPLLNGTQRRTRTTPSSSHRKTAGLNRTSGSRIDPTRFALERATTLWTTDQRVRIGNSENLCLPFAYRQRSVRLLSSAWEQHEHMDAAGGSEDLARSCRFGLRSNCPKSTPPFSNDW